MVSIGLGLFFGAQIFDMLKHADASSNNYIMAVLALGWVVVSLIASVAFFKKPLYFLSSSSYVAYVLINHFMAPESRFNAEFDAVGIACVIFGFYFAAFNSWLLYLESRRDPWSNRQKET